MADVPKRPNYFQSQFLVVRDFEDEQAYHREMLRRHNRYMHEWGVVRDGLQVGKGTDRLSISPGSAIDSLGREIVLEDNQYLSLDKVQAAAKESGSTQDVSITIAFQEVDSPDDKYPGTDNVTRQMQSPIIAATKSPVTDGTAIILARVNVAADGSVGDPDNSARKLATSFIPRGSNLGDISLDGALSFTAKGSPTSSQMGLDYDSATDGLRIRARSQNASTLDTTHLAIKRDTGNVGIGTQPTAARLSIFSEAGDEGTLADFIIGGLYKLSLRFKSPGRDMVSYRFDLVNNNGRFDDFLVFDRGNIGIGAANPQNALEVKGNVAVRQGLLWFLDENGNLYKDNWIGMADNIDGATKWLHIGGITDAGERRITLRSTKLNITGKVGIGTTDPKTDLVIRNDAERAVGPILTLNNAGGFGATAIDFNGYDVGTNPATARISSIDDTHFSSHLAFYTKEQEQKGAGKLMERVRIASDGKVGIGTPEPSTMLAIKAGGIVIPAPPPPPQISAYLQGRDDPIVYAYDSLSFANIQVGDVVSIGDQQRTVVQKVNDRQIRVDAPFNFVAQAANLTVVTKPTTEKWDIFRADDMDGNTKFFIAGDGKVGIGLNKPTALLTLQGGSAEAGRLVNQHMNLQSNRIYNWYQDRPQSEALLRIVGADQQGIQRSMIRRVAQANEWYNQDQILLEATGDENDNVAINDAAVYILSDTDATPLLTVQDQYGGKILDVTASDVHIISRLNKSSGAFKIDHPLDPANKYLYHSFVESPDMKNIYDGVAVLDSKGEAVVELPEWFEALNKDFRYQLTPLNSSAPNLFIAQEIRNGCFKIAGGPARTKLCWQVTGIRRDAYANANRIRVEEDKLETERGRYLHPEAFGQPPEKSITSTGSNGRGSSSSH